MPMIRNESAASRIAGLFIHLAILAILITTLYPILHVAAVSLSSDFAVRRNNVTFFPRGFTLLAYRVILSSPTIPNAFLNSVIYTVVGTALNMSFTTTMAYALAKPHLPHRGFFTILVIITFFFSGGLIPSFLVVRGLGLYNTMWALLLPVAIATWNLVILRTFFQTIPQELEDSARVDGANDLIILFKLVLPISKAAVATITLFYAVSHWNSWFPAVIYLSDFRKLPLQVILRNIVIMQQMAEALFSRGAVAEAWEIMHQREGSLNVDILKYATLFVSIVPMLIVFPFIQKHFVKGIMIGSLKG
jgi:putative aldouronate transport system permease protein